MNSALPSGRALILFEWAMYARKGPLYEEGGFFRCGGDRADRVVRPYKVRRRSLQIPMLAEHEIGEEIEDGAEE